MAEQRLEATAQNVANLATYGYKRQLGFAELVGIDGGANRAGPVERTATDLAEGRLVETGNPFDLALLGPGFFVVRRGDTLYMTRNGQFTRNDEGRLLGAHGGALQLEGGGDLIVDHGALTILDDATVLLRGDPIGRVAIADPGEAVSLVLAEGGLFALPDSGIEPLARSSVRQAMLEASNVTMGEEMVTLMEAMRRATTGQRLIQTYDDLMGRVMSTFGGSQA